MVDVGAKPESERRAVAEAAVRMKPDTAAAVEAGNGPKGDVVLQRPPASTPPSRRGRWCRWRIRFRCRSPTSASKSMRPASSGSRPRRCVGRTGVEIEAMAAASIAALTVYDMVKALEREVEIEHALAAARDKSGAEARVELGRESLSGRSGGVAHHQHDTGPRARGR